jgi:hypothetical protein
MMSSEYAAGLFDGEGWFSISRAKGSLYRSKREWAFQAHASLSIRERHIVEALADKYGGTVTVARARKETHSDSWHWQTTGKNSKAFAEDVLPHLLAKDKQATLIISFQAEKNLNGNRPLPDTRYAFYEKAFAEMKKLNLKGVGK